jgi:xanthine dehydrogenase small subunit
MNRNHIHFLRNGTVVQLAPLRPTQTVLDYLRLEAKATGTKEGCNEGDCGACTVVLGSLKDGTIHYEAVNACILLVAHLDGKELVTVDDLARDGVLHPVQQQMVDHHASQCGFCTPGFVMSLFALYHSGVKPLAATVREQLAGNLCRCTGYRPIVDAGLVACAGAANDAWHQQKSQTVAQLQALQDAADIFIGDEQRFLARPASASTLGALAEWHPDATIVAGATDVGLWITKQLRDLPKLILTGGVVDLHNISETPTRLKIGASATYAEAEQALASLAEDVGTVVTRIGSKQVRASGTIGGNIANGSPIGDMPPMMIALGARLILRRGEVFRELALEDYFVAYGKQDRQPGELVWSIDIPKLSVGEVFRAYKISKRFDQDISAVMAAFKFKLDGTIIRSTRIAFGGMAATPKRAAATESTLIGWDISTPGDLQKVLDCLSTDYQPISDMRASSDYRMEVARGLLQKAIVECAFGNGNSRLLEAAE